jgi:hypothetical protein
MVYKWAARLPGNAQACGEELQRLQEANNGRLETKAIVQVARDEDNPLHKCFEWNDDVAAERYREVQARQVIRSIRVVSLSPEGQPDLVRCFVNVEGTEDEARSYVAVTTLVEDVTLFEQARQQFLKDLRVFEQRYKQFVALKALVVRLREQAEEVRFHVDIPTAHQGGTLGALEAGR